MSASRLIFAILVSGNLCSVVSRAATPSPEQVAEQFQSDFKGYQGIVFICEFQKHESLAARVCERATASLKLIAASNRVPLEIVRPNEYQAATFTAAVDRRIQLRLHLDSVGSTDSELAIHARMAYVDFYSRAVEADAKAGDPGSMPRSGELELWSASCMSVGISESEVSQGALDGIDTIGKHAFALYLTSTEKE